jgi:hypothetical protein
MQITLDGLRRLAGELALESRVKDETIISLQGRVIELEARVADLEAPKEPATGTEP